SWSDRGSCSAHGSGTGEGFFCAVRTAMRIWGVAVSSHSVSTPAVIGSVEPNPGRVSGGVPGTQVTQACGAGLRKGAGRWRKQAGWGTNHVGFGRCRLHWGNTRAQVRHSAQLEAEALSCRVMGTPIRMEPDDALQFCIDTTRGEIDYCTA